MDHSHNTLSSVLNLSFPDSNNYKSYLTAAINKRNLNK